MHAAPENLWDEGRISCNLGDLQRSVICLAWAVFFSSFFLIQKFKRENFCGQQHQAIFISEAKISGEGRAH